jgi:hypothetical protein
LAVRHAYLFGRPEVTEEDLRVLARIASDTVPPWIARAIEHLCAAPDHHACVMKLDGDDKEAATYAKDELVRLRKAGLIDWSPPQKAWTLVLEHAPGVAAILAGCSFPEHSPAAMPQGKPRSKH